MVNLTDEEIRELWQDEDFPANHSGITTFRNALQNDKNFRIPMHKLRKILQELPAYLDYIRRPKKFKRRAMQPDGYLNLMQIDIGIFIEIDG